jgi:hypothetical protein
MESRHEVVEVGGGMQILLEGLLFLRVISFSHLLSKRDFVDGEQVLC